MPVLTVGGAAMTMAYAWRFWAGIFLGEERAPARPIPHRLTAPVVLLGGLVTLAYGVVFGPPLAHRDALVKATGNERFAWDSYRRFVQQLNKRAQAHARAVVPNVDAARQAAYRAEVAAQLAPARRRRFLANWATGVLTKVTPGADCGVVEKM